jgi:hypothetical protein
MRAPDGLPKLLHHLVVEVADVLVTVMGMGFVPFAGPSGW